MGTVSRRCAMCGEEVSPSSIFCSEECRAFGRVVRDAQPSVDECHTLANLEEVPVSPDVAQLLADAAAQHRMTAATIVAAYAHNEKALDATIWAAHTRGLTDRQIGALLEMRTASVQRRVLAFQARLHGPAPAVTLESVS